MEWTLNGRTLPQPDLAQWVHGCCLIIRLVSTVGTQTFTGTCVFVTPLWCRNLFIHERPKLAWCFYSTCTVIAVKTKWCPTHFIYFKFYILKLNWPVRKWPKYPRTQVLEAAESKEWPVKETKVNTCNRERAQRIIPWCLFFSDWQLKLKIWNR